MAYKRGGNRLSHRRQQQPQPSPFWAGVAERNKRLKHKRRGRLLCLVCFWGSRSPFYSNARKWGWRAGGGLPERDASGSPGLHRLLRVGRETGRGGQDGRLNEWSRPHPSIPASLTVGNLWLPPPYPSPRENFLNSHLFALTPLDHKLKSPLPCSPNLFCILLLELSYCALVLPSPAQTIKL